MSKENGNIAVDVLMIFIVVVTVGLVCWGGFVLLRGMGRSMGAERGYYCQSLKKIVKAEPIYEDNGKYEDEAYRVTYEDGAIGLVDNATFSSGYYCVSETWMKTVDANNRGYVKRP